MATVSICAAAVEPIAREPITTDKGQLYELLCMGVDAELPASSLLVLVALWADSNAAGTSGASQSKLRGLTGLSLRGIQLATRRIPGELMQCERPATTGRQGRANRYTVACPSWRVLRGPRLRSPLAEVLDDVDPRQLPLPSVVGGMCATIEPANTVRAPEPKPAPAPPVVVAPQVRSKRKPKPAKAVRKGKASRKSKAAKAGARGQR